MACEKGWRSVLLFVSSKSLVGYLVKLFTSTNNSPVKIPPSGIQGQCISSLGAGYHLHTISKPSSMEQGSCFQYDRYLVFEARYSTPNLSASVPGI